MEHESMVHALGEIHRILKPDGFLLDLRPLEDSWSVEVVSGAGWQASGRLSDQAVGLADDEAANQAMREVQSRGWFIQKKIEEFPFFYYWDTPSEMKEFMETEWEDFEKIEEDVYRRTASLWAESNADARVRVRVKMRIAALEKGQTG
jgi:SAM-dependent methyltransferase